MAVFTASANELATMEEQLEAIGREVRKLRREVADERRTLTTLEARRTAEVAAELDAARADVAATEAVLNETEIAYQAKVAAFAEAKANLESRAWRATRSLGRML